MLSTLGRSLPNLLDDIKTQHLLSRCPHCRAEVEAYEAERRAGTSVVSWVFQIVSSLLRRLIPVSDRENQRARRDLDEILSWPHEEREERIKRARSRFRSPVLVKLLLEESRRSLPSEALHLAEMARVVVNRNPRMSSYFDLYALATAHIANACRASGDLRAAHQVFTAVRRVMPEHGVTDPAVPGGGPPGAALSRKGPGGGGIPARGAP